MKYLKEKSNNFLFNCIKIYANNSFLYKHIKVDGFLLKYFPLLKMVKYEWLDVSNVGEKKLLRVQEKSISYGPVYKGNYLTSVVQLPTIFSYKIDDATVHVNSSSFIKDSSIFLERINGIDPRVIKLNSGHLLYKGKYLAIIKEESAEIIERGFFLGGNGCGNYYHYLIEIIPKLEFFLKFKEYPLLVSEDVERINNFKEILNIIIPEAKIIFLKRDRQYIIEDMIYITSPNILPFNINFGYKLKVEQFIFSPRSVEYIRTSIFNKLNITDQKKDLKIFLKREKNKRKYNESEIENMLLDLGFVSVKCEDLNFSEQVNIFNRASHIVGPTGASWSNIIFSSNAKAICWMPGIISQFSAYSSLARLSDVDLRYIFYKKKDLSYTFNFDYKLELEDLKTALNSLTN